MPEAEKGLLKSINTMMLLDSATRRNAYDVYAFAHTILRFEVSQPTCRPVTGDFDIYLHPWFLFDTFAPFGNSGCSLPQRQACSRCLDFWTNYFHVSEGEGAGF
jgi:hypothetical protein